MVGSVGSGSQNSLLLHIFGDMKIAPPIIMRTVFALQIRYQLTQRLAFVGHDVGQQQRIQKTVTLRQKARIANSAGLLAADDNFTLHHQVSNVFESDGALVQFAAMLGGNAIDHARRVEGAHDFSGPFLSYEQPLRENGKNLVRIDKAAV